MWTTLLPASKHWCLISLLGYFYLVCHSMIHAFGIANGSINTEKLRITTLTMCALYFYEVCIAVITNSSTLYGWRKFDFIIHHLAFVCAVTPSFILDSDTPNIWKHTAVLIFLMNINELYRVTNQFNIRQRIIEDIIPFYMFIILIVLIIVEIMESVYALMNTLTENLSISLLLTAIGGCTCAPAYHLIGVLPYYYKRMLKVIAKHKDNILIKISSPINRISVRDFNYD